MSDHFPDWFRVGGQLEPQEIAVLAQQGIRAVINNRPDGEAGPEQPSSVAIAEAAKAAGVAYAHLPVVSGQFTEAQITEMARLLKTLPRPILAFCRSGTRSGRIFQLALQVQENL